jgi:hypothetical protein
MAAWLRSIGCAGIGAGMLAAGSVAAARGISGEMGAVSRASATITLSVAPRFKVAPAPAPGTVQLESNVAKGRFTYRFAGDALSGADPKGGKRPTILIIVPD